jgi:hypothetical protein
MSQSTSDDEVDVDGVGDGWWLPMEAGGRHAVGATTRSRCRRRPADSWLWVVWKKDDDNVASDVRCPSEMRGSAHASSRSTVSEYGGTVSHGATRWTSEGSVSTRAATPESVDEKSGSTTYMSSIVETGSGAGMKNNAANDTATLPSAQ